MLPALLPDLGDHAGFIWMSYAAVAGVLAALAIWLILDGRDLERRVAALDRDRGKRDGQ